MLIATSRLSLHFIAIHITHIPRQLNSMRLFKLNTDGSLTLSNFIGSNIPRYGILSHRWESDDQEVTYRDIIAGTGGKKAGYRKIEFCRDRAQQDELPYFWIDSCCINRDSSAELQEAITSMFRWYHNSAKCYIYLTDISTSGDRITQTSSPLDESAFKESQWFTRGWTLQELLAPKVAEFYSREGYFLGDRITLEDHIHDVTRIPVGALRGQPLTSFDISDRMKWTDGRQTTIDEDQAYCLLGIFEVFMPHMYGEGLENAFRRLRVEIASKGVSSPLCRLIHKWRRVKLTNIVGRESRPCSRL